MKKQVKTASELVALTGYQDFLKPAEVILAGREEVLPDLKELLTGAEGFLRRREVIVTLHEDFLGDAKESLRTPEEILGGANEIMISRKTAIMKQKTIMTLNLK